MGRTRIDLNRPASIPELLERVASGEEVLLEHEGAVVALVSPVPGANGLAALFDDRRNSEPLDEDWERDMALARELLNRPAEATAWE